MQNGNASRNNTELALPSSSGSGNAPSGSNDTEKQIKEGKRNET